MIKMKQFLKSRMNVAAIVTQSVFFCLESMVVYDLK